MNKQTAVEWLVEKLDQNFDYVADTIIEQAKAMEKEQIVDAHIEGQRVFDEHPHTQWTNDQAEEYYNQTYKTT